MVPSSPVFRLFMEIAYAGLSCMGAKPGERRQQTVMWTYWSSSWIIWPKSSPSLRRRNVQTHVAAWVDLSSMTGCNQDAMKKTVAGLLKLQHPHRSPETLRREEIGPLVEVAVEMRQRITDQLAQMLPAEFGSVDYRYTLAQA